VRRWPPLRWPISTGPGAAWAGAGLGALGIDREVRADHVAPQAGPGREGGCRRSPNAAWLGIAGRVYDYIATGGFEPRYKTMEQAIFRKADGSDTGGCVEVAALPDGRVQVRDTKHRDGGAQTYTGHEWSVFIAAVKNGEFDLP
jgi:Domain of unknown function (DUF397)